MDREAFRFNLRKLIEKAKSLPIKAEGITISLPFVSIRAKPDRVERDVAREVVIRLADKRVLNAWECCDGCVKNAMDSIQEIRSFLVEMEVKLKDNTSSALYLLIEFMLEGVRQFLTFTESLGERHDRTDYFGALKVLRPHLFRCLSQIAVVADMEIPQIPAHMRYDLAWEEQFYLMSKDREMPRTKELPSNVIPFNSSARKKSVRITGDQNIVADGDVHIEGGIHVKYAKGRGKKHPPTVIPGTVATDARKVGYLEHLVRRYNEFKESESKRSGEKMNSAMIRVAYEREIKYRVKETPLELFEEAVAFLQHRIANTIVGRNLRSRGQPLFSSFEEFDQK